MEYPLWFDGIMLFILFFTLFIATTQPQIPRTPKGITFIIAIIAIFLFSIIHPSFFTQTIISYFQYFANKSLEKKLTRNAR